MQTALADFIRDTPEGREADRILRSCVHCGFCTATCPTYQLLGDELDGPRGRIYLIKQVLEGHEVTATTQLHLDRCLTCRNCETTCPSGVQYGRLLDIGRHVVDRKVGRTATEQAKRWGLRRALLSKPLFGTALMFGRAMRGMLPADMRAMIPQAEPPGTWPAPRHARKMLVLEGCVQPSLAPNIDRAMARVLDRIGISLVRAPRSGCCGALPYHTDAPDEARALMKRNIDAWWPHVERGAEAIVVTASGCGVVVKDYGYLLERDPGYAEKAARIASLARDPVEVIAAQWLHVAPLVAMDHGAAAGRVPGALQPAARHEAQGRGGGNPAGARPRARSGGRQSSVLRLRGHVLDPAACDLECAQGEQARRAHGGKSADHRQREHRVHEPSRERHRHSDPALDRDPRRAHGRCAAREFTVTRMAIVERPGREAYRHFVVIPTRWMDNDIYGHVNNVTYYSYFDTAVNAHLIAAGGLDIREGPAIGLVVETLCRFHKPLTFPDTVHAGLRVAQLGRSSVRYDIGLFRNDDPDPTATGHFVHVWVERETRTAVPVPDAIRAALVPLVVT